jgi:hypothetical protein
MNQIRQVKRGVGSWSIGSAVLGLAVLAAGGAKAGPPAYQPAAGYRAAALDLKGAAMAVSPGGRLAVAQDAENGGATVAIYDRVEVPDRKLLQTLKAPQGDQFKFIGGIVFEDDDTLFFSENGEMETVFRASVGTGEVRAVLPKGSLESVADLAIRPSDGRLFALVTPGPGKGAVYTVTDGQATSFARGLGVGYVTGLAFSPTERLFVGDTADPTFAGKPGQILELGPGGEVAQAISLAAGGGSGLAGLAIDAEGDLFASTGATLTEVRLVRGAQVHEFGRFAGTGAFPAGLLFRGHRFEPESGDGVLLVDGAFTPAGGLFEIAPEGNKPYLSTDFAMHILAANGVNGSPAFRKPEVMLGPPSASATPTAPAKDGFFSFGWGGSVTLAFDRPILNDPAHPGGLDFVVYGNAFYVGGDIHLPFQEPGYVEVAVDRNGNGQPDPDEPFYLLRGRPDPGSPPRFPLVPALFGVVDHRTTPVWGYADVTPTDGTGDPLMPDDPMADGITPGSAGGDAFDLSWAVDREGHPVALDHVDFVRITHALNATSALGTSSTEVDAVSLVRPAGR